MIFLSICSAENLQIWTPIDMVMNGVDPVIELCQLDFKKYAEAPHEFPMFRTLVTMSNCNGDNKRSEKLSVLMTEYHRNKSILPSIPPTGFIFHEGRVGSTLVANMLGSDPDSLVFSESTPPAKVLSNCNSCDIRTQLRYFKDIITLMGVSTSHKRLFFKFQSIASMNINVALEAFPATPWTYLFRSPVQVLVSQIGKGGNGAPPCLRSRAQKPHEIVSVLRALPDGPSALTSNEAWCAGHINMLSLSAYQNIKKFSHFANGNVRGFMLLYDSLPGVVPKALLRLFKVNLNLEQYNRMKLESAQYSKGGKKADKKGIFEGDSLLKESIATDKMREYSSIVLPVFNDMLEAHKKGLLELLSAEDIKRSRNSAGEFDWELVKAMD